MVTASIAAKRAELPLNIVSSKNVNQGVREMQRPRPALIEVDINRQMGFSLDEASSDALFSLIMRVRRASEKPQRHGDTGEGQRSDGDGVLRLD